MLPDATRAVFMCFLCFLCLFCFSAFSALCHALLLSHFSLLSLQTPFIDPTNEAKIFLSTLRACYCVEHCCFPPPPFQTYEELSILCFLPFHRVSHRRHSWNVFSFEFLFLDKGLFEVRLPLKGSVKTIISTLSVQMPRDEVVALFESSGIKRVFVENLQREEFTQKLAVHLRLFRNNFPCREWRIGCFSSWKVSLFSSTAYFLRHQWCCSWSEIRSARRIKTPNQWKEANILSRLTHGLAMRKMFVFFRFFSVSKHFHPFQTECLPSIRFLVVFAKTKRTILLFILWSSFVQGMLWKPQRFLVSLFKSITEHFVRSANTIQLLNEETSNWNQKNTFPSLLQVSFFPTFPFVFQQRLHFSCCSRDSSQRRNILFVRTTLLVFSWWQIFRLFCKYHLFVN